jgi:hypothetical protein
MSLKKLVIFISLFVGLSLFGWEKLYPLNSNKYSFSDFGFKDIDCLELRAYPVNPSTHRQLTKNCTVPISICEDIGNNVYKRFQNIKPNLSCEGDIRKNQILPIVVNAMTIDKNGKIWSMNEIEDVLSFIGEIDTPAKIQLVLWLYGENQGTQYRKLSDRYEIIIRYKSSSTSNNKSFLDTFLYKLVISTKGKLINKKLVKHTKKHTPSFDKPSSYLYSSAK